LCHLSINVDYWMTLLFKSAVGIDYKHCVTFKINVDFWMTLLSNSAVGIDYKHCVTLR